MEEEGVLLEVDVVAVLEIVVEEVKILITVSQVIKNLINLRLSVNTIRIMDIMHMRKKLINLRLSVITVRIMDIMHMKRDSIIRTSKVEPYVYGHTEAMPIVSPLECNVAQESPCDIRYLDSRYSKEMT